MQIKYEWHQWFAWYPVRMPGIYGRLVWLQMVRRKMQRFGPMGEWWVYEDLKGTR